MQLANIRILFSRGCFQRTWSTSAAKTVGIKLWVTFFLCLSLLQCRGVKSRPRHGNHHHEPPPDNAEDGDVWLIGGKSPGTGNVLVYHQGEWGSVCDDGWNQDSAHIVCRSIGHPYALGYTNQAYFGKPKQPIKLDDIRCYGDETSILDCNTATWGVHNCDEREAAGVYCAPKSLSRLRSTANTAKRAESSPTTITTTTVRTTTTTPRPTTLPWTQAPTPAAMVATTRRQSGAVVNGALHHVVHTISLQDVHKASELLKTADQPDKALEQNENEINEDLNEKDENSRQNNEINALETDADPTGTLAGNATVPEAASRLADMKKQNEKQAKKKKATKEAQYLKEEENVVEQHHTHSPGPYEIRIVNGRDRTEGRVEVHVNGIWGLICSDNWSLLEARVACNQAGLGYAKMAARGTYFGGSEKPKVLAGIKCDGLEDRLSDCYHEQIGDVICPETQYIAGVVCTFNLPDLVPNGTMLETSSYLQDQPMHYIQCAMEEGCAASSAYRIKQTTRDWGNQRRRLMRFSSSTWNYGTADFHPFRPKNTWEWHMCHMHYHSMDVFAHYDLLDMNHNRVAEGHKASFCLEDVECLPDKTKRYECVGFSDQGISIGCADNYLHNIDCQWIDVTDVKPGKYIFRVHINPEFKVAELDYQNNAVTCDLAYTGYTVIVENCLNGPGDHLPRRP